MTEQEFKDWVIDEHRKALTDGVTMGRVAERERIIERIKDQVCFDALADDDGRCANHGGKCYDLRLLIDKLNVGEA
jgi:hypothetical protein